MHKTNYKSANEYMTYKGIIYNINKIKGESRAVKENFLMQLKLSWYQFKIE